MFTWDKKVEVSLPTRPLSIGVGMYVYMYVYSCIHTINKGKYPTAIWKLFLFFNPSLSVEL